MIPRLRGSAYPAPGAFAVLVAWAATAIAAPEGLADCRAIADPAQRLACYDRVSGRAVEATPPAVGSPRGAADAQGAGEVRGTGTAASTRMEDTASLLETAWGLHPDAPRNAIRFYNANYLLFGRYTNRVNTAPYAAMAALAGDELHLDDVEAKFQLSFKARLWTTDDRRWSVWAAYTQQNQWQVYNDAVSRPFRETNYMPELFVTHGVDYDLGGGFRWRVLNAGFNHQSNGRTDAVSRSWNRLFAEAGIENGNLALVGRLWWRIPESAEKDDNPDITDYYGYGSVSALYRWRGHSFLASARGNVAKGKGAFEFGWTSPPILGPLRAYVQVFTGYGESMIDYNWNQTTVGAGIALSDGL
ncbi:MAG: phospholipase A [Burkholderiales bacterium]|nr:phospholipase A [Burkholderiales bacterium]